VEITAIIVKAHCRYWPQWQRWRRSYKRIL